MELSLYDSLSQKKRPFHSLHPKKVSLYVCGNTVYDDCHIGHARVFVSFDVLVRFFQAIGYQVHYVQNITDIDDKIIQRANQNKESITELTERYITRLQEDNAALFVLPPTEQPKCTESIEDMIAMITTLLHRGVAYVGDNHDVYYDVARFKSYGALSHRTLANLQAGARVDVDVAKKSPLDFVLWKSAKPGEPAWASPWGQGRPGWHIECSAMSTRCLGNHFDIHGGGADLLFPHHENERAQSEAATGETFANTWMHVGFVQVNHEKMSKSLGNFFTIRDVLKKHKPEAVRYFLLSSHYRSQIQYSEDALQAALQSLTRLYTALKDFDAPAVLERQEPNTERFLKTLSDDLNTPQALAILFEIASLAHKTHPAVEKMALQCVLKSCAGVLGLLNESPQTFFQGEGQLSSDEIDAFIQKRHTARAQKNWALSDEIRATLLEAGVVLEDKEGKTSWRRL
jgi:cysteinyl-tRNA synthetase